MSTESLKRNFWTLLTAAALVGMLAVYTICFTVEAGSAGVVKTFGAIRIGGVKYDAGLYPKWPWPIQSVSAVDTRTRLLFVRGKEELTVDQFNLITELTVGWEVNDAALFVSRLENSERRAEELLRSRVTDARKRITNSIRMGDIITTRAEQAKEFSRYEADILSLVVGSLPQDKSANDYGIRVNFIRVKRLAFPANVTQEIFNLMVKERKRVSERYRSEGENQAKIIKQNAERERDQELADAEAQAIILKGEGDAEAVKYYQVFSENPELANYVRKLDAFKATLKENATLVLPSDEVPFNILKETPPVTKAAPEAK